MSEPAPPRWTRRALVLASAVMLAGVWLVLEALGFAMPSLGEHWPLFLVAGGVASIADWALVSRRPGALALGVFGLVLGVDLWVRALRGVPWRRIGAWGPGIWLAIGLACLAAWGAGPRRSPHLLVVGVVAVGLAITFWGWGELPLALFWGLLLVTLAVALVVAVARGRGR